MKTGTYSNVALTYGLDVIISWIPGDPMCSRFVGKVGTVVAKHPNEPNIWRISLLHPMVVDGETLIKFVDVREGEALTLHKPPRAHAEFGPNPYILHQAGKLRD